MFTEFYKRTLTAEIRSYSPEEFARWTYLRAIEWGNWPHSVSQIIVPILLPFFDVKVILLGLIFISFVWICYIRSNFLFLPLLTFSILPVAFLKWPLCIGVGVYFFVTHKYFLGFISTLWPIWMLIITFIPNIIFAQLEKNKYGVGIAQKKIAYLFGMGDLEDIKKAQDGVNKFF